MDSRWMLAAGLAIALVLLLLAVLLLRRRRAGQARAAGAAAPARAPASAAPAQLPVQAAVPDAAGGLEARRQAAAQALRQARQRSVDEAARIDAARQEAARQDAERSRAEHAQAAAARARMRAAPAAAPAAAAARTAAAPAAPAVTTSSLPIPPSPPIPPAPAVAPAAAARAAPAAPVGAAERPAPPPRSAQPPRAPLVLLADDSKVVRVKTGRLLQAQGWQVLLAEDGAAALAALDSHAPDLLITDVEMPGLDGFALTRRVRAHPRLGRMPVIMITSSDERHRAEADAAGVNLLLGKPYAEDALLAQVRSLLASAAQRAGSGLVLH